MNTPQNNSDFVSAHPVSYYYRRMPLPGSCFLILFIFLMVGPISGYSSPDIAVINAKTGKICSLSYSSFRQMLVDINTRSCQFSTLCRKDNIFTKNRTSIYTTYDEACRKLKVYTFPMLFEAYGSVNNKYTVQGDKMVYIKHEEQTLLRRDPIKNRPTFHARNLSFHLYDMATKSDKVIASNAVVVESLVGWFMRWISNAKILFLAGKSPFIIDTISGKVENIYDANESGFREVALAPDFTMLAFTEKGNDGIKILELGSKKILKTIRTWTDTVTQLQWSPDSNELAYVEIKQVKVCNIASGEVRTLTDKLPAGYVFYHLVFGKDIIGYAAEDINKYGSKRGAIKTLHFINADTGKPIKDITLEFNGSIRLRDNDCTFVCETGF